jgi:hypothetical protein
MGVVKGRLKNPVAEKVGLLANGSSGSWDVALDETFSGKNRWFMQLEGPSIYLYFEISSPRIVTDMLKYLGGSQSNGDSHSTSCDAGLRIGCDKRLSVKIVKDDEFADRIFVVVGPESAPVVRYTISGKEVGQIVEALQQVEADLET